MKTRNILNIVLLILIIVNIVLVVFLVNAVKKPTVEQQASAELHKKVISFHTLFIEKVIASQKPVSEEDRVALENSVLQINNPELTKAWNTFVKSNKQNDMQTSVVKLLSLLVTLE